MLKTAIAVLFISMAVLVMSCGKPSVLNHPSANASAGYDMSVRVAVRNHTFLPINREMDLSDLTNVEEILKVVEGFEKEYPNLEVMDFKVEKQQKGVDEKIAYIFGIWIDHRTKT